VVKQSTHPYTHIHTDTHANQQCRRCWISQRRSCCLREGGEGRREGRYGALLDAQKNKQTGKPDVTVVGSPSFANDDNSSYVSSLPLPRGFLRILSVSGFFFVLVLVLVPRHTKTTVVAVEGRNCEADGTVLCMCECTFVMHSDTHRTDNTNSSST
jgi:hypothetical protein